MLARFKKLHRKKDYAAIIPHSLTYPAYTPASRQAEEFHASDKHIKALFGGDRAGKTGTVSYEFITLTRRNPGKLYWCVALTEDKLSAVWQWHKYFLAPWEITHINWRITNEIPRFIKLRDGGKIQYLTWKSGAGIFSADSVYAIQLDEDGARVMNTAEQVYNDCLSRILDCDGYILLGATPVMGKNWMYRRIYLYNADNREGKTPDPDIARWTVSLLDNRYISDEQKAKAKGRMSADEVDRRFYGLFSTLQGACFKEWQDDMVVDFGTLPADCRKAVGIDLGYKHPFVAEFGAYHNETLYYFAEHYKAETLLKDHAEAIRRIELDMSYWHGLNFRRYEARVCDHERQTRAELEEAGIWTDPADKAVDVRIDLMNRMMKEGRFLVHPRCYELARTLPLYHYKEQRAGSDQKEQPVKEDDDPVDAGGYLAMYFEGGSSYDLTGGFAGSV
ncbi:hypothetical protein GF380_04320 [Candidatus Uhrbacteria bacterium]|nr:hypothetical protein [Candidatus Uhrbacteria bacterium]